MVLALTGCFIAARRAGRRAARRPGGHQPGPAGLGGRARAVPARPAGGVRLGERRSRPGPGVGGADRRGAGHAPGRHDRRRTAAAAGTRARYGCAASATAGCTRSTWTSRPASCSAWPRPTRRTRRPCCAAWAGRPTPRPGWSSWTACRCASWTRPTCAPAVLVAEHDADLFEGTLWGNVGAAAPESADPGPAMAAAGADEVVRALPRGGDTAGERARALAVRRAAPARGPRPRAGRRPGRAGRPRPDHRGRRGHRGPASPPASARSAGAARRSWSPPAPRCSRSTDRVVLLDGGRITAHGPARRPGTTPCRLPDGGPRMTRGSGTEKAETTTTTEDHQMPDPAGADTPDAARDRETDAAQNQEADDGTETRRRTRHRTGRRTRRRRRRSSGVAARRDPGPHPRRRPRTAAPAPGTAPRRVRRDGRSHHRGTAHAAAAGLHGRPGHRASPGRRAHPAGGVPGARRGRAGNHHRARAVADLPARRDRTRPAARAVRRASPGAAPGTAGEGRLGRPHRPHHRRCLAGGRGGAERPARTGPFGAGHRADPGRRWRCSTGGSCSRHCSRCRSRRTPRAGTYAEPPRSTPSSASPPGSSSSSCWTPSAAPPPCGRSGWRTDTPSWSPGDPGRRWS